MTRWKKGFEESRWGGTGPVTALPHPSSLHPSPRGTPYVPGGWGAPSPHYPSFPLALLDVHLPFVIPVETGIQFFEFIEVSAWTIYESRLMHLQEAVREALFIYCEFAATKQIGLPVGEKRADDFIINGLWYSAPNLILAKSFIESYDHSK